MSTRTSTAYKSIRSSLSRFFHLGKHFGGHVDRAIYISHIHSSCSSAALQSSLVATLTGAQLDPPERVLLAQPMWSKAEPSRFERCAWMIMPSKQAALAVLEHFKDGLEVSGKCL